MRIYLKFKSTKNIMLPIDYNHIVQAMILNYLGNEDYQKFIHNEGYECNNRFYKMYTFSKLQGKFILNKSENTINFFNEINLVISSADSRLPKYFTNEAVSNDEIKLGRNSVYLEEIKCIKKELKEEVKIYTKSPITVYSTLTNGDKKKTYYYNPMEDEFNEIIRNNLTKKYLALNGKAPINDSFKIKAINKHKLKERVIKYKGFIIKAWDGEFLLQGSQELLNIAYDTGVGSKNSQGFGCIEICKKEA